MQKSFFNFFFIFVNILISLIFNKIKNQIKSDALLNAFEKFQLTEKEMNDVKGGKPAGTFISVCYKTDTGCLAVHYDELGNTLGYELDGNVTTHAALVYSPDNTNGGSCSCD